MHTNFVIVPTFVYKKVPYKLEVYEFADNTAIVNVYSEKGNDYFFTAKVRHDAMALDIFDVLDDNIPDHVEKFDTPYSA